MLEIGGSTEALQRGPPDGGWLERSDDCSRTSRSPVCFESVAVTLWEGYSYCVLTVWVTFQKRVQYLQMAGNLLSRPPLPSSLIDVLGNQFVSTIRFPSLRPLPSTHRWVCLKSYNPLAHITHIFTYRRHVCSHLAGKHLQARLTIPVHHPCQCLDEVVPYTQGTSET